MAPNEETAATTTRLPARLLEELQHAVISRRTSQQAAIIEGVQMWLAGGEAVKLDDVTPENIPLVLAFPRYLQDAPEREVQVVRQIIQSWIDSQQRKK